MNRRIFLKSSLAAGVGAALPVSHVFAAVNATSDLASELVGRSAAGDDVTLAASSIKDLASSLRGSVLLAGDSGYEQARRVLNEGIDRHPALVVQPIGVTDIRRAVDFARDNDLLLAVKCGGHSYSGKSTVNGGIQIDLSTFRHARVQPDGKTINVAGGSLLGEIDREAMQFGLATPSGTVSHTGVGGLATGGGFGRLARKHGLALDNIVSVDVVTADGKLVHASADQNEDLYWGVRGGGGNFGVVTNFEFALHPTSQDVIAGVKLYPVTQAREILQVYRDVADKASNDFYIDPILMIPPDPVQAFGGFVLCHSGSEQQAAQEMAALDVLGTPAFDSVKLDSYVAVQKSSDNTDPRNQGQYLKSGFINEIPDALIESLVDGLAGDPGRTTMVYMQQSGGAIAEVARDATAFSHRDSVANMFMTIAWPLDQDGSPHIDYLRDYWASVETFTDGYYSVDSADEPQRVINANYQGNYERLVEVKNQYDPTNLFRLNANIKPTI